MHEPLGGGGGGGGGGGPGGYIVMVLVLFGLVPSLILISVAMWVWGKDHIYTCTVNLSGAGMGSKCSHF